MSDARAPFGYEPPLCEHVHLIGIGGAGLSGAARLLVARGHRVSGSDRAPSSMLSALEGVDFELLLDEESLPRSCGLVVHSAAVGEDHPHLVAARERGLPVLKYAQLLALLAPPENTLAVAGTHGKTTTSWLLWHALEGFAYDGLQPGALVGGLSRNLGTNAVAPGPEGWFAVEACEYDRSFLALHPRGAIVTNVEGDHLDYYGSLEAVERAFARFASQVDANGLVVLGREVPAAVEHASRATVWRLGRELEVDLLGERAGSFTFRLRGPGWGIGPVDLALPGSFNVENAALALALAVGLAAPDGPERTDTFLAAAASVGLFEGAGRRFEPWGTIGGVRLVHDYAHHPTEVRVTLEAARRALGQRPVHVLFQPHQHSRTARFFDEFVQSLLGADRVVVSDVYGARNHIDGERIAGAEDLVRALKAARVDACYGGSLASSVRRLCDELPAEAAVLVLGAGDVEGIRDELLDQVALRGEILGGPLR